VIAWRHSCTAVVSAGATLELAGTVSALANGANRVNITNNSTALGVLVSGTNQIVGYIDGSGTTQVNAGSDLTANHIIQNALVIGGTSKIPGLVTIDASDANGNPVASGLLLTNSSATSGQFSADISSSSLNDGSTSNGSSFAAPSLSPGNSSAAAGVTVVPEPSTVMLSAFAMVGLLGYSISRRRKNAVHWLKQVRIHNR
jgi:PEP-CTERM motif